MLTLGFELNALMSIMGYKGVDGEEVAYSIHADYQGKEDIIINCNERVLFMVTPGTVIHMQVNEQKFAKEFKNGPDGKPEFADSIFVPFGDQDQLTLFIDPETDPDTAASFEEDWKTITEGGMFINH